MYHPTKNGKRKSHYKREPNPSISHHQFPHIIITTQENKKPTKKWWVFIIVNQPRIHQLINDFSTRASTADNMTFAFAFSSFHFLEYDTCVALHHQEHSRP